MAKYYKPRGKVKQIQYPPEIEQRVEAIRQERVLRSQSQAIEYAIVETYRKLNPKYIQAIQPLTPEQKVDRKNEVERIKREQYREKMYNICEERMGGTLDEDAGGHFTCTLTQYTYYTPTKIIKGERVIDEHEIESFQKYQYNKFPENMSEKEKLELASKAVEI